MSASALSPRARDIYNRVVKFIKEKIEPFELEYHARSQDPEKMWTIHPKLEELKVRGYTK